MKKVVIVEMLVISVRYLFFSSLLFNYLNMTVTQMFMMNTASDYVISYFVAFVLGFITELCSFTLKE